jgi:hypothetical protein
LIWLIVVVGALLLGASSGDPGGVGEVAAGVGFVLTSLYFLVRRLRTSDRLIDVDEEEVGSATATWLKVVAVLVLWVLGSVLAIVARVPDQFAVLLGWLLPLTVFLVYRSRRSARDA